MKALQISAYGDNSVVAINSIAPLPKVGPGTVLVKVYKAALNPVDWKMRNGSMKAFMPLDFPATIGGDFSGVVEAVGDEVRSVKVGDEVFGNGIRSLGGSGAFAEYVAVPESNVAHKPESLTHNDLAAVVSVGTCAYLGIDEVGQVTAGQRVLVHGGAGGVGSLAVQLAKAKGAHVTATAAASDRAVVHQHGAEEVLDYATDFWATAPTDYDLVLDTVGGDTYRRSFGLLKPGGKLVSFVAQPDPALMDQHGVTAFFVLGFPQGERLRKVRQLLVEGIFVPTISKVFPLDQGGAALDFQENGHPKGKIVLSVL